MIIIASEISLKERNETGILENFKSIRIPGKLMEKRKFETFWWVKKIKTSKMLKSS